MSADSFLQRIWYGRSWHLALLVLIPLSWLFRIVVAVRRWSFRTGLATSVRLPKPVIVVGNITVGGTGKTPVVLWLAGQLRARGRIVGIINRGYGGRSATWPCDVTANADPVEVGDEAVLLAKLSQGIVVTGPDRVAAARRAIELGADVIVSDDGLQHYRLARDCELAVTDADRGAGNGNMLPAGPLREPEGRLAYVDALLLKQGSGKPLQKPVVSGAAAGIPFSIRATTVTSLSSGEQRPLDSFRNQPVHAVAGIGNPEAFFASLREAGMIVTAHALPDHAAIAAADLEFGDAAAVLMTAKDAVKCRGYDNPRLWVVDAEAVMNAADAARLLSIVETRLALVQPVP